MHYREIANAIMSAGLVQTASANPSLTVNARIAEDIKRRRQQSPFIRIEPGVFGLRGLHGSTAHETPARTETLATSSQKNAETTSNDANLRVRVPLFPLYSEVRHLLRVWPSFQRKQVTSLQTTINSLRGTPQKTVDWTDPATWIPDRLKGGDRKLAQTVWERSNHAVNPRHTYGHWLLAQRYALLREDGGGVLQLTTNGQSFLEQSQGVTEFDIDEAEGLIKLLSIVADNGPARAGGLVEEWGAYLSRRSRFGTRSTIRDTMRRRLGNLLERGLVERKGNLYSITAEGLAYLERAADKKSVGGREHNQVRVLMRKHENTVRASLRELLHRMDPYAVEHVVKRLLEEMDYRNVDVTARSGDGGIDVVGDIELGITSIREVVQVKRHRAAIQRKDLDALRGSLYRFNAVRGTIITTSRFAKGTKGAAFAPGVAPITLIDGDKLVDLLIEHGIGVRKRPIELLEVDPDDLASIERDD